MASNDDKKGNEKVTMQDGNLEENRARLLKEVSEDLFKKTFESYCLRRSKQKKLLGPNVFADCIGTFPEYVEYETGGGVRENEEIGPEGNVKETEQEVIDEVEVLDGLEDIDVDFGNDINLGGDDSPIDIEKFWADKGKDKDTGTKVITDKDKGKGKVVEEAIDIDTDTDDESYKGESGSSDTEESVESDFEVVVDEESENDDEDLSPPYVDGPVEEGRELLALEGKPFFMLGMAFADKEELKRAVNRYAISEGVSLKVAKSGKGLLRVVCQPGCPFVLYASTHGVQVGFTIKTLVEEHDCARVFKNPRASAKWLSEYYKDKVKETPRFRISEMKKQVEHEMNVHVSIEKCKRAKRKIMQEMEGCFKDEFANLDAYCNELRISNPGSDISVEVSNEALEQGRRVFRRMYVCFNASKVGWREGCRPFIGVDGTFLKGKAKGILLTAVGVDANNSLFPLAFGLTEKENGLQWGWFLQWIQRSLLLGTGATVTLMSDMQKGLVHAVNEVLPEVEHRFCARHIYANWSKRWKGDILRDNFWACVWSSYEEEFIYNLKALSEKCKEAAEAAISYPPKTWVRAYFSTRCKAWFVDNNKSESLNYWVDECRYLPVIRMFEGIRLKMMNKWARSENNVRLWKKSYSPNCMSLFEANRQLAAKCRVEFNGDEGYEVTEGGHKHVVCLSREMCTCRAWDLTGIPCQHSICAMWNARVDPITKISRYYHKDTYVASYRTKLQPVRGRQFWDTDKYLPMLPPPICTLPGRPPTKRVRTEEPERRKKRDAAVHQKGQVENAKTPQVEAHVSGKISRRGRIMKCSISKKEGHNRTTCREAPSSSNQIPQRKRKNQQVTQPPPPLQATQPPPPSQPPPRITKPKPSNSKCCGMGLRIYGKTGRTVFNSSLSSEVVLSEGTSQEYMRTYGDPQKKFPIPNELQMRLKRSANPAINATTEGSIRIQFKANTSNPLPSELPVKPPGLKWRGNPCVTTRQLLAQRQSTVSKSKPASKSNDI